MRENAARQARYRAGDLQDDVDFTFTERKHEANKNHHAEETILGPKKDFFGRIVREAIPLQEIDGNLILQGRKAGKKDGKMDNKVWVSFHEGYSNAVRKPITIEELLRGL